MITLSFDKVLTIVYMQAGLDANNISTIDTINNYKYYHAEDHGNTDQEHSVCYLS